MNAAHITNACSRTILRQAVGSSIMRHPRFITLILIFIIMTTTSSNAETAVIGRVYEDGLPLIYSFVNEQPSQDNVARFQWLTIVSWKYDGSNNNGMPPEATNAQMIALEDFLSEQFENSSNSIWVFNRTGNHLKEFAYYINDRDAFIEKLNQTPSSQPRYPIEINFYNDPTWQEFRDLLEEFRSEENNESDA